MSLDIDAILDAIVSHAMGLGLFERVNQHEPKNSPGNGLTCAVWVDRIDPYAKASGLAKTAAKLTLNVRLYTNMMSEPQDAIDPNMVKAVNALMLAYSGDFELGGSARNVDLLGASGSALSAQAGFIAQGETDLRVFTISLPLVVNDAWDQAP